MAKTKENTVKKNITATEKKSAWYIPHLAALGIFLVITLLFFSPFLFDNKMIPQGDITQWEGMSKEARDYYEKNHSEALWSTTMFSGMPAFQISTHYNGNLMRYTNNVITLFLPEYTGYLFLACLTFYIMLLAFGISPWLAIIGAIGYSLSSYNLIILEAGHNSKMHAIALLPLLVAGIQLVWDKKYIYGAVVTAVATALLIMANHVQIMYYGMLVLGVYGLVLLVVAIKEKDFVHFGKFAGVVIVSMLIGIAANTSLLWSTYEYGKSTIRGKSELASNTQSKGGLDRDYAFQWSYGTSEILTLLIPDVYGNSSHAPLVEDGKTAALFQQNNIRQAVAPYYWGAQPFTSGPVYIGAIICFLFVVGLFIVDSPLKWWLAIATLFTILLSFGKNFAVFNNLIFDILPGYNKFRTVAMALVIAQFTIPTLAILALAKLLSANIDKEKALKYLYVAFGITGGIALFIAFFGSSIFNFVGIGDKELPEQLLPAIREDRASMMRSDAFRSFFLIFIAFGVLWAYLKDKISKNILIGCITIFTLFDMVGVGKRFINSNTFIERTDEAGRFPMSAADQQITQDKGIYRVFNQTVNTFNDASTSYYNRSIGGYHAAKLRRYQELIENQIAKGNMAVLNMLNTKYVIGQGANGQPIVQQNPAALGNAWFVNTVKVVKNADEEMAALTNLDPKTTAITDALFAENLKGGSAPDSLSAIKIKDYQPNKIVYEANTNVPAVAVFSEIYYQPGWEATIDGKAAPIARVNYLLRSMLVPAGKHTIEMKFVPQSYFLGEKIAMFASALIIVLMGYALYVFYKKYKATDSVTAE